MQDWLSAQAQVNPNAVAVIFEIEMQTYRELDKLTAEYAAKLGQVGVGAGHKVGVLMQNSLAYVWLIHAVMRLRAILVPLNTRLTASEIQFQLEQSDCQFLIYDSLPDLLEQFAGLRAFSLSEFQQISPSSEPRFAQVEINLEQPLAIIFTSGTTGKPKGTVLTYGNFFYSAMASAYRIGVLPDDRWCCVLPLYHVGGLSIIIRSALYGTAIDLHPRFEPERVHQALATQPITLISLVPTMLYRLLEMKHTAEWSDRLRLVLLGGAAASPELVERCIQENIPIATTYGLSEATSQVATMLPDDVKRKPGSVGKPLLFSSVQILDENGQEQPPGDYGEVVVSGLTVMQGYYADAMGTGKTLKDGKLYTGDIGYLDEDGDLWLVQRRSDLIVSGGENVYPAEVEAVLKQHPAVKDVCVVGVKSQEWGQQVAAVIILQPNQAVSADDIIAYSREHLAGYKQPRLIQFVDALPQTASGKIQRAKVVELFA